MGYPVDARWEARISNTTGIKKDWADATDDSFNGLYGGTKTVKAVKADGTGNQASAAPAGNVEATNDVISGRDVTAQRHITAGGTGNVKGRRLYATGGTALTAGDIDVGGWGTGASVDQVNADDTGGTFRVTCGAAPPANPQAIVSFKDGNWSAAPHAIAVLEAVSTAGDFAPVSCAMLVGSLTLQYKGTPTAGRTYTFRFLVIGK